MHLFREEKNIQINITTVKKTFLLQINGKKSISNSRGQQGEVQIRR